MGVFTFDIQADGSGPVTFENGSAIEKNGVLGGVTASGDLPTELSSGMVDEAMGMRDQRLAENPAVEVADVKPEVVPLINPSA